MTSMIFQMMIICLLRGFFAMITTFLVPIHSQFSHMHFECELALHFMQYAYIISGHYPEILGRWCL